ncbi:MAG: hypothetical protein JXJ20_08675 [Anaerolineae bacterium]|jgi:hypothetical protein|nr:hypothetical protein [Anaerolineae bacterium]
MRKLTCPPGTETIGQLLNSWYENLQGDETRPIMEKHGMVNLNPTTWYPVRMLLDATNEIAENCNVTPNFVAIGMKIGEAVPLPPDMENPTLEEVLMIWDDLYQGLHRGGDVGCIKIEKVSDTYFKTIQSGIYPDDMSYGVLYAYGRRFLPPGTSFSVFYDPDVTPRDQGGEGEATYINIKWSPGPQDVT